MIKHLQKPHCVMNEYISSNKRLPQLRFVLENKDLKSKVRRINLKWILLNKFEFWVSYVEFCASDSSPRSSALGWAFHCLPMPRFSWFTGDSAGVGYHVCIMPRPELKHKVRLSKTVRGIFHFRSCFVFIKVYIFFNKMHGLFDFKSS